MLLAGESREARGAFAGLRLGIALAFLLVFAVKAVQFESLKHPVLIMTAVPFDFVGVVLTLLVTNTTFSLNAFLDRIVLVGFAVNNAIALADTPNLLRREHGLPTVAATVEAAKKGLRPILMTAMTTMLAMLLLVLALREGSDVQAPLARVVLGGLIVSTLITLVLLPTLYALTSRDGALRSAGELSRPVTTTAVPDLARPAERG